MSTDFRRPRSHSRTDSNSFRIPIQFLNSSTSISTSIPTSITSTESIANRRKQSINYMNNRKELSRVNSIKTWLGGRVGRNNSIFTRPWLKRWMVLLIILAVILITLSRNNVKSMKISWREGSDSSILDSNKVPRVDRTTLEKLRLLELHYGPDEDWEVQDIDTSNHNDNLDTPPRVVNIPDPIKSDPSTFISTSQLPKLPSNLLDPLYCPEQEGRPCAFLLVGFIGEQETKAQLHLHQLGLLALSLNRTLVLPNVAKSRMGSCYTSPFSFYYSPSSLSSLGIPTISQENFLEWNERRFLAPSAQIISLPGPNLSYPIGKLEINTISDPTLIPNKPTRRLCLKFPRTRLNFNNYSPIAIHSPEGYHKNDKTTGLNKFGDSVIQTLRSEKIGLDSSRIEDKKDYTSPDVLVLNWELRFPILSPRLVLSPPLSLNLISEPLPFTHFPYAETWSNISLQIASSLSPFIAIHWRTETLLTKHLVPCAYSLVNKIESLHLQYPSVETIYLATDYPLQEIFPPRSTISSTLSDSSLSSPSSPIDQIPSLPHSGTFAKSITPQHHLAFKTFLIEFEKLRIKTKNKVKLTTFDLEIRKLHLQESIRNRLIISTSPSTATTTRTTQINPIDLLDPGLIGIIDKGVAIQAEIFLTGLTISTNSAPDKSNTCGKISSFTRQIIKMREDKKKIQDEEVEKYEQGMEELVEAEEVGASGGTSGKKLWNEVTYWSADIKGVGNDEMERG